MNNDHIEKMPKKSALKSSTTSTASPRKENLKVSLQEQPQQPQQPQQPLHLTNSDSEGLKSVKTRRATRWVDPKDIPLDDDDDNNQNGDIINNHHPQPQEKSQMHSKIKERAKVEKFNPNRKKIVYNKDDQHILREAEKAQQLPLRSAQRDKDQVELKTEEDEFVEQTGSVRNEKGEDTETNANLNKSDKAILRKSKASAMHIKWGPVNIEDLYQQ